MIVTLDMIRVFAAFYVVLHHLHAHGYFDAGYYNIAFRFGQEAVIAFFLLSGFVIHASERDRAGNIFGYATRRIFRIYPPLILAMLFSIYIAYYDNNLEENFSLSEAVCNLLGLQDRAVLTPGTICSPFMRNTPLWSLSYEIVFYFVYPLVLPIYLKNPNLTQHIIGIATLLLIPLHLVWPHHLLLLPSYFLIWWCGAMMAQIYLSEQCSIRSISVPLSYLTLATGLWAAASLLTLPADGSIMTGYYPILNLRHFMTAMIFVVISFSPIGKAIVGAMSGLPLNRISMVLSFLSSISYGIYILHYPILIRWSIAQSAGGLAIAMAILFLTSYLFDNRTNHLVRKIRARRYARTVKAQNPEPNIALTDD